jgi:hypothetical protein
LKVLARVKSQSLGNEHKRSGRRTHRSAALHRGKGRRTPEVVCDPSYGGKDQDDDRGD